jgi:hypothetical protein
MLVDAALDNLEKPLVASPHPLADRALRFVERNRVPEEPSEREGKAGEELKIFERLVHDRSPITRSPITRY